MEGKIFEKNEIIEAKENEQGELYVVIPKKVREQANIEIGDWVTITDSPNEDEILVLSKTETINVDIPINWYKNFEKQAETMGIKPLELIERVIDNGLNKGI